METLKLNKASITFRKYVDSKIGTSTKLQKKAIDISKSINEDYNDNIQHIILLCSNDSMTMREVKNNKQYIESKLGKSKEYLNHLQLAFRIAGSKVIKAKFKSLILSPNNLIIILAEFGPCNCNGDTSGSEILTSKPELTATP